MHHALKDNLQWKMTFGGRQPLVEDNLWWKTTFSGGWPLVENNLRWRTTFSGRQPSVDPCMLLSPLGGIFLMFSLLMRKAKISYLSLCLILKQVTFCYVGTWNLPIWLIWNKNFSGQQKLSDQKFSLFSWLSMTLSESNKVFARLGSCDNIQRSMRTGQRCRHGKRRGHADIVRGKFWELWKFLDCGRLITLILE